MNTIWDAVMAIVLDAAVVALIVHLLHTKAVNKLERVICVVLAYGMSLGMMFFDQMHIRVALVICAVGVLLSYAATGLAFLREEKAHE